MISAANDGSDTLLHEFSRPVYFATLKGAVSRNSAKLGNYKIPVKLTET